MSEYELIPPFPNYVLTPEAQEEYDDWYANYEDEPCYCSACSMPPCSTCENSGTHSGHPLSLNDDHSAWENQLISEVRKAHEASLECIK